MVFCSVFFCLVVASSCAWYLAISASSCCICVLFASICACRSLASSPSARNGETSAASAQAADMQRVFLIASGGRDGGFDAAERRLLADERGDDKGVGGFFAPRKSDAQRPQDRPSPLFRRVRENHLFDVLGGEGFLRNTDEQRLDFFQMFLCRRGIRLRALDEECRFVVGFFGDKGILAACDEVCGLLERPRALPYESNRELGDIRIGEILQRAGVLVVGKALEVFVIEPFQFFDIEYRAALMHVLDIEFFCELGQGKKFSLASGIPAEKREVIDQCLRQESFGTVLVDRDRPVPLRHF